MIKKLIFFLRKGGAFHQCGPGSNPGGGMWVEFVVGSLPCCERFFFGYSGFPLSPKTNISKFQFNQESGRRRTTSWMCYLQIIIHYSFSCMTKETAVTTALVGSCKQNLYYYQ